LPTPEWPTITLIRPASTSRSGRRSLDSAANEVVTIEVTPSGSYAQQRRRVGQVRFGQAEHRGEPRVVRGDQAAVDHPRPGRRVGQRGDDHQLVGVRHDDPLDRVGVVGGAAQHVRARVHPHDAGERVRPPAQIADQRHPVADDDPLAAQLPRLHRDDLVFAVPV
jgi:hypothetical protein